MLLGWPKTNRMCCCSVVLLTSFVTPLHATSNEEPMPDMALLEYLAELVEVDGKLVGPMEMAEKLEKDKNENNNEQTKTAQEDRVIKREDKEHD